MSRDNLPPDPAMPSASTTTNGNTSNAAAGTSNSVEKKPDAAPLAPAGDASKQGGGGSQQGQVDASTGADVGSTAISCPVCGLLNRPGELSCARCGSMLVAGA